MLSMSCSHVVRRGLTPDKHLGWHFMAQEVLKYGLLKLSVLDVLCQLVFRECGVCQTI